MRQDSCEMSSKLDDDTYICDCGAEWDNHNALNGHGNYCDEFTPLGVQTVRENCSNCGKFVYVEPYRKRQSENIYCNSSCHNKDRETKTTEVCSVCGETFECSQWRRENGWGDYCSYECRGEGTSIPQELRVDSNYGPLWPDRRLEALSRDSWQCQSCGIGQAECREKHATGLHVHHKTPYRKFDSDEEAHQLDNLMVLCPPCHREEELSDS